MASKRSYGTYKADLQQHESPYAFYGTPLPALDDHVRDDGSYVPVWKQEVRDERGRKRLHGAFTGGFSAGYFNTVGSKEGWTPSTFVSSRSNRMKDSKNNVQQRPEDFMDEEDLREVEESKTLATNEGYAGFGSTAEDTQRMAGFIDLFRPLGDSRGAQLLRRMGWRDGQGIGPKVRRKLKGDAGDDEEGEYHLLAPDNPPLIAFINKQDHRGIGYGDDTRLEPRIQPLSLQSGPLSGNGSSDEEDGIGPAFTAPKFKKKSKGTNRQGGFGVGILNDTGSDEEDPYEMGPKILYNRTIVGDKARRKKEALVGSNPLLKKPTLVSKKIAAARAKSGFQKCRDGRYPPDGFILSNQLDALASMAISNDSFKPPEVPNGWKSAKTPETSTAPGEYVSTADAARKSTLDIKSRAALLGETQLPGKSVFDFLNPAAREKIAHLTGNKNLPAALGEKPPAGYETSETDRQRHLESLIPSLDADVALQALSRGASGWMPYSEEPSKRSRYTAFLSICAGLNQGSPERPPDMSKDNWVAELNEFVRAAQVFKPVSGLMASRFTSSSQQPQSSSGEISKDGTSAEPLLNKPLPGPEDPAEQAAKLGMFGPMTRSITDFYPTRLLCKRFNVKVPDHVSFDTNNDPGKSKSTIPDLFTRSSTTDRFQSSGFRPTPELPTSMAPSKDGQGSETLGNSKDSRSLAPSLSRNENGAAAAVVIDADRNEALEGEKPGEAVFKAIFGSDDEGD